MFDLSSPFVSRFRRNRTAMVGLVIFAIMFSLGMAGLAFSVLDPFRQADDLLARPFRDYALGTDHLGRDILARVLAGATVSTYFALGVGGISIFVGVVLGAMAGYFGGWIDDMLSRFVEFFLMIPHMFLIILLVSLFGGGDIVLTMVVVGLLAWPTNAKIIRAQVLSVRRREFVESAVITGVRPLAVLFRHVVPNCITVVIANSTVQMANAILTEAALSFLGLGDPNVVSWGQMIYDAQSTITYWWTWAFPGVAVSVYVLGLNLVGDGVGFAMNPRLGLRDAR